MQKVVMQAKPARARLQMHLLIQVMVDKAEIIILQMQVVVMVVQEL